jgi:outer membrane receptor for ferrienterochelin and colicin
LVVLGGVWPVSAWSQPAGQQAQQPAVLEGHVIDHTSEEVVAGARVGILYVGDLYEVAPAAEMVTDETGAFSFRNVPPGPYHISVDARAYEGRIERIELGSGESVDLTFRLARSPVQLRGEVREAGTRKPLAAVEVRLIDPKSGAELGSAFTDADAKFSFRGLAPGTYRLAFEADGYEALSFDEEVRKGELTTGTYYLHAEHYGEHTVRTTTSREKREVSRERISLEELRRVPGSGGDVVRVVQNMPGVARPSYTLGSLIVRGAAPQDTKVFLQGDSIPLVYHFLGGPAVINSEMIEAVDFYPGNFSAYYGRATGGIVQLRTRSPREDRVHGFTEIDIIDATAQIEGPVTEDLSFALSGRRSYIDTILPYVLPEEAKDSLTVSPRYYDYQGWLSWRGFEGHEIELFVYGSDDQIATVFDSGEPVGDENVQVTGVEFGNSFHRAQLRWEWKPRGAPIENVFMASFGLNSSGFEVAENLHFSGDYYQTQIREDLRVRASEQLELRLGADMQLGRVGYNLEIPRRSMDRGEDLMGTGVEQPNYSVDGVVADSKIPLMQPAFYTEAEWKPVEGFKVIPGLRLDYYGDIKEASISPRLAARYQALEDLSLKGGVGLFTQPPLPGQAEEFLGNPELTFEKAVHYAAGAEWKILEYLDLDTTLFFRDMFDLVNSTGDVKAAGDSDAGSNSTGDSAAVESVIYDNAGQGRAYGLELLLRHYPREKFFGWIAYTLSRAERWDPLQESYHPFDHDQTHILTTVAGYNLPWELDVSARFRLVTGTPYTPVAGSVFEADRGRYVTVYGPRLSARNSTFHQLDVRVDKKFVFDTFLVGAYVEVLNAYNAVNEEGRQYNYDATQSQPVPGLPIIPTLGLNGRF